MARLVRLFAAAGVVAAIPLLGAESAGASLTGPCEASGTLRSTGDTYDAKTTDEVEIPREDDVDWSGQVPGSGAQRNISGFVKVDLPAPLPDPEIGKWDGPSSKYQNSGTYHYEFPSVLEGFDIRVYGTHHDAGFDCSGEVTVKLEGGGIGNPLTLVSLALTVFTILNLVLAVFVL
jgi:hypothetical protein